jgi:hypothetical protein
MTKNGNHDIAQGNRPLLYEGFMQLLLSACSTLGKNFALPDKQSRNVNRSAISSDDLENPFGDTLEGV